MKDSLSHVMSGGHYRLQHAHLRERTAPGSDNSADLLHGGFVVHLLPFAVSAVSARLVAAKLAATSQGWTSDVTEGGVALNVQHESLIIYHFQLDLESIQRGMCLNVCKYRAFARAPCLCLQAMYILAGKPCM